MGLSVWGLDFFLVQWPCAEKFRLLAFRLDDSESGDAGVTGWRDSSLCRAGQSTRGCILRVWDVQSSGGVRRRRGVSRSSPPASGLKAQGSRAQVSVSRVSDVWFLVYDSGLRVECLGFKVQG